MKATPKALRLHIAIIGRTNVGKSSFLNLITGQDVAITSPEPGTTTDVVEKTMELLPIGPVVFIDTAGLNDATSLGSKRLNKTNKVFDRADVILLVHDQTTYTDYEKMVQKKAVAKKLPVIHIYNKTDLYAPPIIEENGCSAITCCALDVNNREQVLSQFKKQLLDICPDEFIQPPPLLGDLLRPGGLVILIVPIDMEAPKGRLILPQVQSIRDALDNDAAVLVVKESEYAHLLTQFVSSPDIVVCDSQVVLKMVTETPPHIPCTTFSILFARLKGNLQKMAAGAAVIDHLQDSDKILIAESCSHHALEDDIGRVKIPRWLRQYSGANLQIDVYAGRDFPDNLHEYNLVVQCGGCMHNRREILSRIEACEAVGVPITNYGVCISQTQSVLKRVLSPFPTALETYENMKKKLELSS